jgi:hypothetical protein
METYTVFGENFECHANELANSIQKATGASHAVSRIIAIEMETHGVTIYPVVK